MKMRERSEIRLNNALDILISYQAYCLSAGCEHKPFAEALYDDSCTGIMQEYYNDLNSEPLNGGDKNDCVESASKIVKTMPYVATKSNLADAFILLNRNLKRGSSELCVMSWYDMETIIDLYNKQREYVNVLLFGTVSYGMVSDDHVRIVKEIMTGSIRDVKKFEAWSDFDCPLHAIALWLLYDNCSIDDCGMKARFLSDCDNTRHIRDNVVFTKVLWKYSLHSYTFYAKNYSHDCIDMVASLLYSLPAHCEYMQSIPEDVTRRNIVEFMSANGGYRSEHVKLSQADHRRAIAFKDVLMLSSYDSDKNLYVVSIVTGRKAYVINLDGRRVFSSGLGVIRSDYLNTVGNTFDYVIKTDNYNMIESIISNLSKGYDTGKQV